MKTIWDQKINIIISKNVCPAIDSAHGSATVSRPVSLEPVWPEGVQGEKNFHEKWPVAESRKKKVTLIMLFYGKILLYTVYEVKL